MSVAARSAGVSRTGMSAIQATRHSPTRGKFTALHAASEYPRTWVRPGAGEPPAIALIKEHLNAVIVSGVLLLAAASQGQRFTGLYGVLAAISYGVTLKVMSRPRLEHIDSREIWWRDLRHMTVEWRVKFDLEYLKNWSRGLDIRILIRTISIALRDQSAF
jgi:hypothetical protein